MNPLAEFMRHAKGLARNPLGVIALFISLIYGFACLVLSSSLANLKGSEERLPLIWFIFIFPILILIAFVYLVAEHHEKLYAPGDYKDESNFVKTLDSKKQTLRLQKEVEDIKEDIKETPQEDTVINDSTSIQNTNSNNVTNNVQNIQSSYLIAEDLALRAFEQDRNLDIKRQSKIILRSNATLEFDGVAITKNNFCGIEVKFTVHSHLSKILRNRILGNISFYTDNIKNENFHKDFKLIVIVVSESSNIINLKQELESLSQYTNTEIPVEYVVYPYNELKKRFGVE